MAFYNDSEISSFITPSLASPTRLKLPNSIFLTSSNENSNALSETSNERMIYYKNI